MLLQTLCFWIHFLALSIAQAQIHQVPSFPSVNLKWISLPLFETSVGQCLLLYRQSWAAHHTADQNHPRFSAPLKVSMQNLALINVLSSLKCNSWSNNFPPPENFTRAASSTHIFIISAEALYDKAKFKALVSDSLKCHPGSYRILRYSKAKDINSLSRIRQGRAQLVIGDHGNMAAPAAQAYSSMVWNQLFLTSNSAN